MVVPRDEAGTKCDISSILLISDWLPPKIQYNQSGTTLLELRVYREMAANSLVKGRNPTLNESMASSIVIFQCKKCQSILGDSSTYVGLDRELELICVHGMYI